VSEPGSLPGGHAVPTGNSSWDRDSAESYRKLAGFSAAFLASPEGQATKKRLEAKLRGLGPDPEAVSKWSDKVDEETQHPLCLVCGNKCAGTTGGELWCCTCGKKLGS